ncbi:MAG: type III-B CRISPR module RAMP protein Cmr6 [Acidobacteria bacterium]|nr:type III-B CRISPR module RAMP protein Cmr6 [Acidobacteriota bacterium]MDW7984898.1 type III-B CRISPR module RAMP protein Cmr6 [Acidobacteriota bacterium]
MHRRQPPRQDSETYHFHTVFSPRTPAGQVSIERRRIREVRLQEPFRNASPGFFFERIVPLDLRHKLSEFKPHLWKSYLDAYGQGQRFRELIQWIQKRQESIYHQAQSAAWEAKCFDLRLTHRMVVGLGATSTWETAMVWHRPTGLPYIPASALKGLARARIVEETFQSAIDAWPAFKEMSYQDRHACLKAIDEWLLKPEANVPLPPNVSQTLQRRRQEIFDLFGHTEQAGLVEFLDAFPTEPPKFELDVMNVHYPEYYRRLSPQALDTESPNPVVFLTVARTPFRFIILCDRLRAGDKAPRLLEQAANLLKAGLQTMGVGAKTRLGYGRFQNP